MPTPIQLCTHRFLDNHKCGSPALRGELFCYFHHPRRRPTSNRYERQSRRGFNLPAPQSLAELQTAIGIITERLASNRIDVHRASLLLYSLQLASRNLPTHRWAAATPTTDAHPAPVHRT